MGAISEKIVDILRGIASSLQFFLPATFLVSTLIWLLMPSAFTGAPLEIIAFALAVITVLYLLQAFNGTLISILQGYFLTDSAPISALTDYQLKKFYEYHERIYNYNQKIAAIQKLRNDWQFVKPLSEEHKAKLEEWEKGWREQIAIVQELLADQFPPTPDKVLPTGFGNIIAAFEFYPERQYCINYTYLWPRFVPTLLEKRYTSFIENEKALLDFFINLLVISSIIWVVAVAVFAFTGRVGAGIIFFLLPFFVVLIYNGACVAANNWGTTVKSAFDLYRFDLCKILNIKLPDRATLENEQMMWQGISDFLAYRRNERFNGYDYGVVYNAKRKDITGRED